MDITGIRKNLESGRPTIGTWLQLPSPDAAEIMARAGYDWVCVDMEHGSFGPDRLPDIFRAIERGGAAPFARLPEASKVYIKTALEAGAMGLIFPMIESREQLDKAIDLATYPGQDFWRDGAAPSYRGVGFCRANAFGENFDEYFNEAAPSVFIAAQIEHINAVDKLDEILGHKRLDAIMVGPYDLSGSMGLTGRFDHPRFKEAMEKIKACCERHGARMGLHIVEPDPAALQREIDNGAAFIAYGIDTVFLRKAAKLPAVRR